MNESTLLSWSKRPVTVRDLKDRARAASMTCGVWTRADLVVTDLLLAEHLQPGSVPPAVRRVLEKIVRRGVALRVREMALRRRRQP